MKALVCGIGGQDGSYLAKLLLEKGYEVHGTSRDVHRMSKLGLRYLDIERQVRLHSMAVSDFRSVLNVVSDVHPDEIYNLSGQSSVGLSFEQPVESMESIAIGTLNLLECIRFLDHKIRFYNASSSECFGDNGEEKSDENTTFRPRSPYAVAKCTAFWYVLNYREAYNLHASSGLLFNHESPIRPERFVTQKIISAVCRIARGSKEKLVLGDIDISRDWGWAEDYVEAMWRITQRNVASDFVVATGRTVSLRYFIDLAFRQCNLRWQDHVVQDTTLLRPNDLRKVCGNPSKARLQLNWRHRLEVEEIVEVMLRERMQMISLRDDVKSPSSHQFGKASFP